MQFPQSDTHFTQLADPQAYQQEQYDAALSYCTRRRMALDVGAHVGIFSRRMARDFRETVAYEPDPIAAACWSENLVDHPNAYLITLAASDALGDVEMHFAKNGWSYLADPRVPRVPWPETAYDPHIVPATTIDRSGFTEVDLVKLDVQGAEALVLNGARETLIRCRPVVLVEEKAKSTDAATAVRRAAMILTQLGARRVKRVGADAIWVFP